MTQAVERCLHLRYACGRRIFWRHVRQLQACAAPSATAAPSSANPRQLEVQPMRFIPQRLTALAVAAVVAFATTAQSQQLTFSPERLARIDRAIQAYVDSGRIAGAVTLVIRRGRVVQEGAYGWADKEAGRKMTADAIFRLASQSKAVTSVAMMMLVEEGRVGLGDPVSRYMPTFAHTTVAVKTDTGRAIVPAKRPITIRDLLTHTAGISYGTDSLVARLYEGKALGPAAGYGRSE